MKKLCLFLILLLFCNSFTACNNQHQCIEVPSHGQSTSETAGEQSGESSQEETSAEGAPDIETAPDGYINANVIAHRGVFADGQKGIHLIKEHSQLMKFYELSQFAITDSYDEAYFKEKAVVFVLLLRGSGSCMLDVKHTEIDNGVLTVTVTDRMPEVGTEDEQRCIFAIEVSQKDIKGIEEAKLVVEDINVIMLFEEPEPNKVEDFSEQSFSGSIERSETLMMIRNYDWLEIITDRYELDTLAERYSYDGNGENMLDFINNLDDNFFETRAIIALPYTLDVPSSLHPNPAYYIFNITKSEEGLALYFRETMKSVDENGIKLIIIDKSILPENNVYNVIYSNTIWEIE